MTNLTFVWDNKADDATLSAGSWEASLPLTNLQTRKLTKAARSTSAANASTIIRIDLGSVQAIGAFLLIKTSLTADAQYQLKSYSDAYITEQVDYGLVDVFRSMFSPDSGAYYWGVDPVWTGQPSEVLLSRYSRDIIRLFDEVDIARYWQIEIFDEDNPNNYVDACRLIMGPAWTTEINPDQNSSQHGVTDLSISDRTLGGAFSFDERAKARNLAFNLSHMEKSEAFQQAYELMMQKGTTGEVYVIPNYGEDLNLLRTSFLGAMSQLDPITARGYGFYHSKSFRIEEIK